VYVRQQNRSNHNTETANKSCKKRIHEEAKWLKLKAEETYVLLGYYAA